MYGHNVLMFSKELRFLRNRPVCKNAEMWVRSPPPAGFTDPKESAVKLNGNAKQLNLETRAEACLAGEVRKCLSTDRTVRRGKAVGKSQY